MEFAISAYITCEDGDTYEGEELEDISVIGVQMWNVEEVGEDTPQENLAASAPAARRALALQNASKAQYR